MKGAYRMQDRELVVRFGFWYICVFLLDFRLYIRLCIFLYYTTGDDCTYTPRHIDT